MKQTRKRLAAAGFSLNSSGFGKSTWGRKAPEPNFPLPNRHPLDKFTPKFRDVYVSGMTQGRKNGRIVHFCYVTSHVHGMMQYHKPVRGWYEPCEAQVANIYASGSTESIAVRNFIKAFKALNYNLANDSH